MSRILPILFNTEMVKAILGGRKTVTRRVVKFPVNNYTNKIPDVDRVSVYSNTMPSEKVSFHEPPFYCFNVKSPCQPGDVLYVRETWAFIPCIECRREGSCDRFPFSYEDKDSVSEGCYIYRAEHAEPERITWRPSIHMPKEAARIFLKVTDVRIEQLNMISEEDMVAEGIYPYKEQKTELELNYGILDGAKTEIELEYEFADLWDSTLKKSDLDRYGWDANPWVWVIEFERCEKPEGWCV